MALARVEFQTKNPAAAAAMPPMNQTNFFMGTSLPSYYQSERTG